MEKVLILLAKILADKKTRDKVLIFIGSIVVGFLLLLAAPLIAIYTLLYCYSLSVKVYSQILKLFEAVIQR